MWSPQLNNFLLNLKKYKNSLWKCVRYSLIWSVHSYSNSLCSSFTVSDSGTLSSQWLFVTPWTARPPCPSPSPGLYSNSCLLSRWCHPTISSSVVPFSSCLQISGSIRVFSSESVLHIRWPNIGVSASASVLPMNIQEWFPLGWTCWISMLL